MPKLSFLACLEVVKKFLVVGSSVVGWGVVVEADFSVQLKTKTS